MEVLSSTHTIDGQADASQEDVRTEDWRCDCRRLLGVRKGSQLEIRNARGLNYLVSTPAASVCPRCEALNHIG